ncbi:peptide ligase PGM1-related protein [Acanthopleuribacter pedis]|uniref:Carboxylate-amine ligase n=1 Tax=Acanthopleuribacter pedis TaxID=442870 RepID=A0A8J7U2S8_9BACT|nr:peptide ligase PGM1-related protein [Acanthopleuribacter pedis]MBO1318887.1 hypothetical protein [Acanthopleuribacter pedis]
MVHPSFPAPGSPAEATVFSALQRRLTDLYHTVFADPMKPRTVLIVPSLSMDGDTLAKITGVHHYEERMLCMLMLLRLPRTKIIYVSSQAIAPTVIDYFLNLLHGVPFHHARGRLRLLNCYDASPTPLAQKILQRPRLLQRIRDEIGDPGTAHLSCFNATELERTLAVQLGIPIYGCDPDLLHFGSKSGGRDCFKEAGILMARGHENLRDAQDIFEALADLRRNQPGLRKAVVKLNEGFSGEGNALFRYQDCPENAPAAWFRDTVPQRLQCEAKNEHWDSFAAKFQRMGGIVEAWIEGEEKCSPSVQCRINPLGEVEVVSTHDQVLGGPGGQIFLGCTFPAGDAYRQSIQEAGAKVGAVLAERGVIGRFALDFITVKQGDTWCNYAIEINLRKGGTTHPFMMLEYLADGAFDAASGLYRTQAGQPRYYYATDNLESDGYIGLSPEDLIDISVCRDLHFHGVRQEGVVFHLIGALSEFGKLGAVCIGSSPQEARSLYERTKKILAEETQPVTEPNHEKAPV